MSDIARQRYYTAQDSWNVTSYQEMFCPLNKPHYDWLLECVQYKCEKLVVG